jgi:hypothetical protein
MQKFFATFLNPPGFELIDGSGMACRALRSLLMRFQDRFTHDSTNLQRSPRVRTILKNR